MPNRILKETICTSDNLDQLSAFHETVFYRMIVNCDDFGRLDARPKILASRLFPLKDIRASQIEDALRALTSAELVTLYEVDGKPFLQMKTWDRHQQIRAKKSKYPGPEDGVIASDINCNQMISSDSKCPRNPIQSESESESNPNPKARAKKREKSEKSKPFVPPTLEDVKAYVALRNSVVDPVEFWEYFNEGQWVDSEGKPVKAWKQKLLTWEHHQKQRPAPKPLTGGRVQPSGDYSSAGLGDLLSMIKKKG